MMIYGKSDHTDCQIMGRDHAIDFVKGIGIILMVLGHISSGAFQRIIYSFHMPLFIVVSGYLFTYPKDKMKYIINRTKGLIYPYVTFNLILIIIGIMYYVAGQPVWFFDNKRSMIAACVSFLCGKGISVTWFLSFLFIVQAIECFLHKKKAVIVVLSFAGMCGGSFFHQMDIQVTNQMWNIVSFPLTTIIRPLVALPFFEAGVLLKQLVEKKNVDIVVGVSSLIIWVMGVIYYREPADLSTLLLSNLILYYLLAICGSYALIFISRYIVRMNRGPVHFVGINSLLYMFCNTIPDIMIIATLLHMEDLVVVQFISIMIVESLFVLLLTKFGSFVFKFDDLMKVLQSINLT